LTEEGFIWSGQRLLEQIIPFAINPFEIQVFIRGNMNQQLGSEAARRTISIPVHEPRNIGSAALYIGLLARARRIKLKKSIRPREIWRMAAPEEFKFHDDRSGCIAHFFSG
jgi:hypothetical protein